MSTKAVTDLLDLLHCTWKLFQRTRVPVTMMIGDAILMLRTNTEDGEVVTQASVFFNMEGVTLTYFCEEDDMTDAVVSDILFTLEELKFKGVFLNELQN